MSSRFCSAGLDGAPAGITCSSGWSVRKRMKRDTVYKNRGGASAQDHETAAPREQGQGTAGTGTRDPELSGHSTAARAIETG